MAPECSVALVSNIGDDDSGRLVMKLLRDYGVDLLTTPDAHHQTRASTAWLSGDSGSRTVAYDASTWPSTALPDSARSMLTSERDILHLDGRDHELAHLACEHARSVHAHVVIDLGSNKDGISRLLPFANTVISPASSLPSLHGRIDLDDVSLAARELLSPACERVFVTAGRDDVLLVTRQDTLSIKPFPVPTIDSNGAGDIFTAGVIVGLVNAMPLEETLHFAAAAAAMKCMVLGNRGLATRDEVHGFLERQGSTRGGKE